MKKLCNVGILGVTGLVGREIIRVLEERNFPTGELRVFASEKSVGKEIEFSGRKIKVEIVKDGCFKGLDILLSAVDSKISKEIIPKAVEEGVVVIDNSSAYRLDNNVPLVIPEINSIDLIWHKGIIANPNCATIIALMAIKEIDKYSKINKMTVSTYQAVSGAGSNGVKSLMKELIEWGRQYEQYCQELSKLKQDNIFSVMEISEKIIKDVYKETEYNKVFRHPILFNAIPEIGDFNCDGSSVEEVKLQNEGRKIMHNEELLVNCTCVRVPVLRCHSEVITVETEKKVNIDVLKDLYIDANGVELVDYDDLSKYPTPLFSSNQDKVYVGRLRENKNIENSITLWCCGDQIRKGAATNAVQIAECLMSNKKIGYY